MCVQTGDERAGERGHETPLCRDCVGEGEVVDEGEDTRPLSAKSSTAFMGSGSLLTVTGVCGCLSSPTSFSLAKLSATAVAGGSGTADAPLLYRVPPSFQAYIASEVLRDCGA